MFIILLKFTENRGLAPQFMEAHKQWIKKGFENNVFLLAGSLEAGQGGCLLAHGESRLNIQQYVSEDPFVVEGVVTAEVLEIDPGMADKRLSFLLS